MFRSKKSMGKHSQCNAVSDPTHPTLQPNPLPNLPQSPLSTNILLSTLQPNSLRSINTFNHSLSPTPLPNSFGLLSNELQFQSFTSLLQPALSAQLPILSPMSNQYSPLALPSFSPPDSSLNIDVLDSNLDAHEHKLLEEVEIVDESGKVLRMKKMCVKDVYKLGDGEKILVHVDKLSQPIKAAGGLCTRFMILLLRQPNICALDARTFHEVKKYSGAKLTEELWELTKKGKEARKTQAHTHTTGSISYARKKHMIELEKKRKLTEIEFFEISHQRKNGSNVHKESKELMEKVDELVKQKTNELGVSGPLDPILLSEIHDEVWKELMED